MSTNCPYVAFDLFNPAPPCDPDEFLIVNEDFAGGAFNAYWNDEVILAAVYSPNTAQVPFPTAASVSLTPPSGNTYIGNYFYKLAQATDNTPFQMSRTGTNFTELYVRWHEYHSAGFIWPQSQKLLRIGNTSGDGPTIDFMPVSTNGVANQALTVLGYDAATATTMFGNTNCPVDGFIPSTEWVLHEFYFKKASGANIADGEVWARIGDVVVCDRGAVVTHTTADKPYNFFWLGGNNTWNGTGPGLYTSVPQNQNRYIDNPRFYSQLPCDVTPP